MSSPKKGTAIQKLKRELVKELRFLRKMKGITQKELAERVGSLQPSIARFESDTSDDIPSLDFLLRIANALGYEMHVTFKQIGQ